MYRGVGYGVSGLLLVTGVCLGALWPAELRAGQGAGVAIDKGPGEVRQWANLFDRSRWSLESAQDSRVFAT
jgi:hypothetical protein